MIIYNHIPKTAGNTMLHLWVRSYGADKVVIHNFDQPGPKLATDEEYRFRQPNKYYHWLKQQATRIPKVRTHIQQRIRQREDQLMHAANYLGELPEDLEVVHGHFSPELMEHYRRIFPDAKIITMLRDPYERAISHIRYILDRPNTGIRPSWLIDGMSLEEILLHPALLEYQSKNLHGLKPSEYYFVGTVERIEQSIGILSSELGLTPLPNTPQLNRAISVLEIDEALKIEFQRRAEVDYLLYNTIDSLLMNQEAKQEYCQRDREVVFSS